MDRTIEQNVVGAILFTRLSTAITGSPLLADTRARAATGNRTNYAIFPETGHFSGIAHIFPNRAVVRITPAPLVAPGFICAFYTLATFHSANR